MRLSTGASTLIVGLPLLAACSSSAARIAPRAVDEAAVLLGGTSHSLSSDAPQIGRLADRFGATNDAIRLVAPQADMQPLWRKSLDAASRVKQNTNGPIGAIVMGVACDAANEKINGIDGITASLGGQIQGMFTPKWESIRQATIEIWQDLENARTSGDPKQRATAVLVCFVVQSTS
jgi:hypothetical protein